MEGREAAIPAVELPPVDDDSDAPPPASILGAIGQLALAVLLVGVLIAVFIGGSALLRRIFG
jgi:hypothetical protein